MILNVELKENGGSECQTVNNGSKRQTKDMTLNVKLKQTTALNAKMKIRL